MGAVAGSKFRDVMTREEVALRMVEEGYRVRGNHSLPSMIELYIQKNGITLLGSAPEYTPPPPSHSSNEAPEADGSSDPPTDPEEQTSPRDAHDMSAQKRSTEHCLTPSSAADEKRSEVNTLGAEDSSTVVANNEKYKVLMDRGYVPNEKIIPETRWMKEGGSDLGWLDDMTLQEALAEAKLANPQEACAEANNSSNFKALVGLLAGIGAGGAAGHCLSEGIKEGL